MAVVQISRIKHRSGLSENLPQLARGEFGLSVDTRELYIGNGGDGAPTTENIQVLTEYSDILGLSESYTYTDEQIGFSAQTGPSAITPITRSLQDKLDDFANVRDFGAVGDGATDDTNAINRALYELFAREQIKRVRRALYFPGGEYLVTGTLKIPSYAKLVGEGPDSTIIKSTDATGPIAKTADSLQQIDGAVGSNSAIRPRDIVVQGITFESTQSINIFEINQAENCFFENSNFFGPESTAPSTVGSVTAAIKLSSSTTYETSHIGFKNCSIGKNNIGVLADNDMKSLFFDGCYFRTAFKGFKIGESVTGSTPSVNGPSAIKVVNSFFDSIYSHGIHVYNGIGFVSAYNYYADVGNSALGTGNASAHVINYEIDNAHSIGDIFDRTAGDDSSTTRRVNVDTDHRSGMGFDNSYGIKFGGYIRGFGKSFSLANNTTASTGITFSDNTDEFAVEIDYYILRNSKRRQGVLRITHDATGQVIDDDFNENNGSVGVTFSLSNSSNITTLNYTTDNQTTGTLYYSVRVIR